MAEGNALPPIDFIPIGRETNTRGFSCRTRHIDQWFSKRAFRDHQEGSARVTCVALKDQLRRPIGFYALSTVAEEVANLPGRYALFRRGDYFSALHLAWLATDWSYTRRGLGTLMVGQVIRTFANIGPQIGLPHLIVNPDTGDHERLTAFYERLGFTPYRGGEAMFLPVQSAMEAVRSIETEIQAENVAAPLPEQSAE